MSKVSGQTVPVQPPSRHSALLADHSTHRTTGPEVAYHTHVIEDDDRAADDDRAYFPGVLD